MGQRWSLREALVKPGSEQQACREDLCVLVHGIEGSNQDMQIWQERLQLLRPEWHLLLAASISQTCRVVGDGIDRLGELLAREVLDALKEFGGRQVRLHFVGHSLGGLVARAALPLIAEAEEVEPEALEYGHFVSLNSPHLGVRSGHPFTCWKNLGDIIPQRLGLLRLIHQVTLQDREELTKAPAGSSISSSSGRGVPRPFLEELADPTGAPSRALRRCASRSAVAASHWDVMVPCCTAAICAENTFPSPSLFTGYWWPFWRIDAAVGPDGLAARLRRPSAAAARWAAPEGAAERFRRSVEEVSFSRQTSGASPARPGPRLRKSSDSEVEFVPDMLQGLSSLTWRRVTYTVHFPFADVHLFTIGKDRKLRSWSVEFIDLLIEGLLEA